MASDEQGADRHKDKALYEHYCEYPGCTKWGGFGFAAGKDEPRWFRAARGRRRGARQPVPPL
ncbi:hypothetical protein QN219_00870 [Sinorhizobium sp. 7-81]|nr:hypothetical protein [Sinorhizobium sp. 8-89]MDK1488616.1 hypothetical protein [Sinorhizobium sp. 8-89]